MKHTPCKLHPAIILLTVLTFVWGATTWAQTNPKDLAQRVRSHVADYYVEDLTVRADSGGVITIEGDADNLFDKLKVGDIASEVSGVHRIVNNMIVHNDLVVDAEIRANIENELRRNDAIMEPEKIKVDVRKGVAYLSGTVSFFREKLLAQSIASWQDGVSDMVSTIEVLPAAAARSDANLKQMITDLLKRFFPLEKHVTFTVNRGNVQLDGTVRNLYSKNHIEEEVHRLIGVRDVKNGLEVQDQEW